ncbi:hypothetical protein D9M68_653020 [compost metagenome]
MQDAFGAAGGAAGKGDLADFRGIVAGDIVRAIHRGRRTGQPGAEFAVVQRQYLHRAGTGQRPRPLGEARVVDHQRRRSGLLQHEGMIRFRRHRMQRHILQPGQLRGDDRGHRFGAVADQEGNGILPRQPFCGKQPRDAGAQWRELVVAQRDVVADDGRHTRPRAQRRGIELAHGRAAVHARHRRTAWGLKGHAVSLMACSGQRPM